MTARARGCRVAGRSPAKGRLLRPAALHGKDRKFRRTGRHSAPSPLPRALAVPALALIGVLVALPQARGLLMAAPVTATARAQAHPGHPGPALAAAGARPEVVASGITELPRYAKVVSARGARQVNSVHRVAHHRVHHAHAHAPAQPQAPACTGTGSLLPANYAAIVSFLTAHGYTGIAAAGIAGNIYQESGGNPESMGSGGGGLIGWTPLPAGMVTGNPAADLQTQLAAILTFNQQWAQYLPALNAAATPAQAADIYVTDFERAGIPAFGNREASAAAVAAACGL
jgi:Phage tail lysozyme